MPGKDAQIDHFRVRVLGAHEEISLSSLAAYCLLQGGQAGQKVVMGIGLDLVRTRSAPTALPGNMAYRVVRC